MTTPEAHDVKHLVIDREIEDLKYSSKDTIKRVTDLEKSEGVVAAQMMNTIKSLDSLIGWIKWALGIGVVAYVSFFAWLMQQQLVIK